MNYQFIYYQLINRAIAQNRVKKPNDGLDRHHIIPKSLGGINSSSNVVLLFSREHYLAHKLLVRMHHGENKKKMVYALWWMTKTKKISKYSNSPRITSRDYEYARKMFIEAKLNNDPVRKQRVRNNRAAGIYKYDYEKVSNSLKETLKNLSESQKKERMAKSTMKSDPVQRAAAISKGKASVLKIQKVDGSEMVIGSHQVVESLGLNWAQVKYRISAHNGLLKDGTKVIIIHKYTGGNKWKNKSLQ